MLPSLYLKANFLSKPPTTHAHTHSLTHSLSPPSQPHTSWQDALQLQLHMLKKQMEMKSLRFLRCDHAKDNRRPDEIKTSGIWL